MDLSIIIVNYHSLDKLALCLESISRASLKDISYEIILVENNSGDDLSSFISSGVFKEIKLINSLRNLGMGGGNNLGIEKARGQYILILNPDVFVKPKSIEGMLNYLKFNPQVGIIGPKLLNSDNSLQYSCFRFPSFLCPFTPYIFRALLFLPA